MSVFCCFYPADKHDHPHLYFLILAWIQQETALRYWRAYKLVKQGRVAEAEREAERDLPQPSSSNDWRTLAPIAINFVAVPLIAGVAVWLLVTHWHPSWRMTLAIVFIAVCIYALVKWVRAMRAAPIVPPENPPGTV